MTDCIFCKIIDRKLPARVVYEDDLSMAFEDINPKAPVHTLVIPKKHIPTVLALEEGEDDHLIGHLFNIASKIARDKGIADKGFRLVTNCNRDSGQMVYHIHLHLLGGRSMRWPPG